MAGPIMSRRGDSQGGYRRRRWQPMSDINVTPMVDVMLVLLVVFMITAPLLAVGVPVDLPKTDAQTITDPVEPLVVSVDSEGQIFIQETPVEIEALVPRLLAITSSKLDTQIYLRGDRGLLYGAVMRVMGQVNAAGFTRVVLIAELPRDERP